MASVKRVLLGCAGVAVAATLVVVAFVFWAILPSGRPIRVFVVNGWRIPVEVHVGKQVLRVDAGGRVETAVDPGAVHLETRNAETGRVLEALDVEAMPQRRIGRWSDAYVEKRSRLYVYNPGARCVLAITDYEYSTMSVPRFGGPAVEEIRGERWILAERITFVFTDASATQEILVTDGNKSYASITVRGLSAYVDSFEGRGEGRSDASWRETLEEALRFDPDDEGVWKAHYDWSKEREDGPSASEARRELLRLAYGRLEKDPCDDEAWYRLETVANYPDFDFPDDGTLAPIKATAQERLAGRPECPPPALPGGPQ